MPIPTLDTMDSRGSPDPVYAQVDALVRDGTLAPEQADRVYSRLRETSTGASLIPGEVPGGRRRWTLPLRAGGAAAVLGAGVLLGALGVAWGLAQQATFNWYAFLVVLVGAVALCVVAAVCALMGSDREHRGWVASVVLAAGIFALALAFAVVLRQQDWSAYVVGALMLVAGIAAYAWLRGSALTVVVVLGGLLVVGQVISDVTSVSTNSALGPGIGILCYGVVVAAAGWWLPSRNVTAMLGGIIALAGVFLVLLVVGVVAVASGLNQQSPGRNSALSSDSSPVEVNGDVWTALILGLLVCLGFAVLYAVTDFVGYLVLGFGGAALLVLFALAALRTDSRLWLAVIAAVVGGLAVAAGVGSELLRPGEGARRAVPSSAPGPYPGPHGGYAPPPPPPAGAPDPPP